MVQGTTSDAGKSLMVAAFCRILARRGIVVAPFKPQNMALNSAVTEDGGEIGRAQALQAQAAGVAAITDFNPILLKPSSDCNAQVIIQGKAISAMQAQQYHDYKKVAMDAVLDSFGRLQQSYDYIIVEGAGSPAEINLREGDIANMGFAEAVDCPVVLVADIDKGGVFAQLVGTLALLSESEQQRIKGFIINKFRGDVSLLQSGLDWLEKRTNKPVLGVIPYIKGLDIAAEDAIETQQNLTEVKFVIVVPVFPRISNHTDFDALRQHPNIQLIYADPYKPLPPADLIILPGSKNVIEDLQHLYQQKWDKQIYRHIRMQGKVLGICGGYQMLGRSINDPQHIEGETTQIDGLDLLPIESQLKQSKTLTQKTSLLNLNGQNLVVSGYEIHHGQSHILKNNAINSALLKSAEFTDGCISQDNQVAGCYLHGLFDSPEAVVLLADWCGINISTNKNEHLRQEAAINQLADEVESHISAQTLINIINGS
ncbi:cobyric acid synthase [Gayadomonas joobiniege]|uniref:cobyric acid synthase n=1 Tax=Gayadomonas joobiniege TaxID=1234606 RepID=UPI0005904092|nr:cobyric acid synthase [Gayadomonas joobiniege]